MRALKTLTLIIMFITIFVCEKLDLNVDVPECIERKIKEFKKSDLSCNSGAEVLRYDFQGIQVYVFQPGNCGADMPIDIYDSHCNKICSLGGIEGRTYCNGDKFYENATNRVLVWKN
jgi:hypothetical protein